MNKGCVLIKANKPAQLKTSLLANILVFICLFSFYYLFVFHTLPGVGLSGVLAITQATFVFIVVFTILIYSYLKPNLGKKHITLFSLGIILTLPFLIVLRGLPYVLIPTFLVGFFFGICQLAYYKVFWVSTDSAKRSRTAGLIGFSAVILYFTTFLFSYSVDFCGNIVLCLLLIVGSTIGGLLINEETNRAITRKMVYYPERRTILLYAVPWVFFSFLNVTLTKNINEVTSGMSSSTAYLLLYGPQIIGGILGALLGGYLADKLGRRLTLLFSVALYGVSMAFRGFTDNSVTLLFSFFGEGLTWGVFLTLYCFVIWGDLANTKNVEKIYATGLIIFYATAGLGVFNLTAGIPVVESTLTSCIMIFLAIIPIVSAPELLTSETQEKDKLRKYIETVRRVADDSE